MYKYAVLSLVLLTGCAPKNNSDAAWKADCEKNFSQSSADYAMCMRSKAANEAAVKQQHEVQIAQEVTAHKDSKVNSGKKTVGKLNLTHKKHHHKHSNHHDTKVVVIEKTAPGAVTVDPAGYKGQPVDEINEQTLDEMGSSNVL